MVSGLMFASKREMSAVCDAMADAQDLTPTGGERSFALGFALRWRIGRNLKWF